MSSGLVTASAAGFQVTCKLASEEGARDATPSNIGAVGPVGASPPPASEVPPPLPPLPPVPPADVAATHLSPDCLVPAPQLSSSLPPQATIAKPALVSAKAKNASRGRSRGRDGRESGL